MIFPFFPLPFFTLKPKRWDLYRWCEGPWAASNITAYSWPPLQNPYQTPTSFSNIISMILLLCTPQSMQKESLLESQRFYAFAFPYHWYAASTAVRPSPALSHVYPSKPAQMLPPLPTSQSHPVSTFPIYLLTYPHTANKHLSCAVFGTRETEINK